MKFIYADVFSTTIVFSKHDVIIYNNNPPVYSYRFNISRRNLQISISVLISIKSIIFRQLENILPPMSECQKNYEDERNIIIS